MGIPYFRLWDISRWMWGYAGFHYQGSILVPVFRAAAMRGPPLCCRSWAALWTRGTSGPASETAETAETAVHSWHRAASRLPSRQVAELLKGMRMSLAGMPRPCEGDTRMNGTDRSVAYFSRMERSVAKFWRTRRCCGKPALKMESLFL